MTAATALNGKKRRDDTELLKRRRRPPSSLHSFLPPIDVGLPPNSPSLGSSDLTGTPPRVYPLWRTVRKLTHRPMSSSDTICNAQDPPLADIVLSGLSLSRFPQAFKTHLHTLYKRWCSPPELHLACVSSYVFVPLSFAALSTGAEKGVMNKRIES
ncbi:hypothetical protein SDJN02_12637, partial [Cucurbita argyrosperma subsp. argyrosperma]